MPFINHVNQVEVGVGGGISQKMTQVDGGENLGLRIVAFKSCCKIRKGGGVWKGFDLCIDPSII